MRKNPLGIAVVGLGSYVLYELLGEQTENETDQDQQTNAGGDTSQQTKTTKNVINITNKPGEDPQVEVEENIDQDEPDDPDDQNLKEEIDPEREG